MIEFKHGEVNYRVDDLPNFPAMHVARKVLPLLSGFDGLSEIQSDLASLFVEGEAPPTLDVVVEKIARALSAAQPLLELVSSMSEQDSEFVVKTCLAHVYRIDDKSSTPVFNKKAQAFQFQLDLPTMLLLTWKSLQENLSAFFRVKALTS
jgi:hypothetical protein